MERAVKPVEEEIADDCRQTEGAEDREHESCRSGVAGKTEVDQSEGQSEVLHGEGGEIRREKCEGYAGYGIGQRDFEMHAPGTAGFSRTGRPRHLLEQRKQQRRTDAAEQSVTGDDGDRL